MKINGFIVMLNWFAKWTFKETRFKQIKQPIIIGTIFQICKSYPEIQVDIKNEITFDQVHYADKSLISENDLQNPSILIKKYP